MSSSNQSNHSPSPPRKLSDSIKPLVAGGIAGIVSRTAVSPLERLKILQQVQHVTGHDKIPKYTSQYQALTRILREEGVQGFFKGNGANCIRVFPYTGLQFLSMDILSSYAKQHSGKNTLTPIEKQFVGGLAGVISVLGTYPMDTARGRLTAQGGALEAKNYTGLFDAMIKMYRAEGIRSLYYGLTPTLLGIYPYVALNYLSFETIKEWAPTNESGKPSFAWKCFAAGVAGVSGQTVAYPLDLLRRRFQLQSAPGNPMPAEKRYKSVPHAFRTIIANEGVKGLFKGFVPNFIKTFPTITIMFLTHDACMDFFKYMGV
jgi:solute carrier family 25 phosphate transporter 23/24/25/41